MDILLEQFEALLPMACEWAERQEAHILKNGTPLSDSELSDAGRIGVQQPERVRLLRVDSIPMPEHPALKVTAEITGLSTPNTAGQTLRYGIFVRSDCWGDRNLVVHELVHTAQYERLGGIEAFLRKYLYECITIGYPEAPMEQEAITTQQRICQQTP